MSNKENCQSYSNIRESSKEFEKKGNNSYIHKNLVGNYSKDTTSSTLSKKLMSMNATTKVSNLNSNTYNHTDLDSDKNQLGNKKARNDSSIGNMRHKRKSPSYISSKFNEILNSSKVGSTNKAKVGINWNLPSK